MPFDDILDRHQDLKKPVYHHEILANGSGFESCKRKVLLFFEKYQLVRYSSLSINETASVSGSNPAFHGRLREAIVSNRMILDNLIREIRKEGTETIDDLHTIPQGYKTKLLHIVTHFVDGFFGIDTYFYNLVEDSHWVSKEVQDKILRTPSDFWILSLDARI
jgi:hypothetical protein